MGCKPSRIQVKNNGDLFNEDTDVRKRFLTGLQISRGKDGVEGNLQIAFGSTRIKRYERVANIPPGSQSPLLNTTQPLNLEDTTISVPK